ncbi:MAG: hypothetical protein PCFJNLEI_02686 [Verrucomicrobiae bacterium]|nr:hypothetical protein [Verrucomicrobiae bacterium]
MRIPILLAHGQGLISYMFVLFGAGAVGLGCLIAAAVTFFARPGGSRRTALRFFLGFIACGLFVLLAPVFIGLLRLP